MSGAVTKQAVEAATAIVVEALRSPGAANFFASVSPEANNDLISLHESLVKYFSQYRVSTLECVVENITKN